MKKILFILIGLFILLAGCGSSEERAAKKVPEAYMDAVKNGDDFEAIDYIDGFIDVLDYEYLKTLDSPEIKDTTIFDYEDYKENYTDKYDTFEEYKDEFKDAFEEYEIVEDNEDALEVWDGESYVDVHRFLYNVEITNKAGEKLHKKAEFTVEPGLVWDGETRNERYKITDIYIQ